ncbi:MAG: gamma-glutamyl-gamma-aminobutyrate hydrolase family protein [Dehalococcoidia bacterium]
MPQTRPRIGVTRWEDVTGEKIEAYWARVRDAGGEPIDLDGPGADASDLDGLVLTGGLDVTPARYGEPPHPKVKRFDPARDDFEAAVLASALERDLPVLAICRGHQLLNVVFGGRLLQHIEDGSHRADFSQPDVPSRWHTVRLLPATRLQAILGADEIEVNSRHHQAVLPETLAPGLVVAATSPDGLIEAVESTSHRWVVGVQWHPERLESERAHFAPAMRPLFEALVREAAQTRSEVA